MSELETALKKIKDLEEGMEKLKTNKVPSYFYKEKKIPKYDGTTDVIEWTENISKYVKSRFAKESDQVDYIIDHLEGKPRKEIRYRTLNLDISTDNLIAMIVDVFGDKLRFVQLQQEFFSRKQNKEESVEDYAYELLELVTKMTKMDVKQAYATDGILKERFAEGVNDIHLRRELIRLNLESPKLKFHELRRRALEWAAEDSETASCKETEATVSTDSANSNNLMKMVEEQQKQLSQVNETLVSMQQSHGYFHNMVPRYPQTRFPGPEQYRFQAPQQYGRFQAPQNYGRYMASQPHYNRLPGPQNFNRFQRPTSVTNQQQRPQSSNARLPSSQQPRSQYSAGGNYEVICHYCKQPNHIKRDCVLLKNKMKTSQQYSQEVYYEEDCAQEFHADHTDKMDSLNQ